MSAMSLTEPLTDWLYVRAYPGSAARMDHATRVLGVWLQDRAYEAGADRWFFTRYVDMTGQHLRMRLRSSTDSVDLLHGRLPELVALLHVPDEDDPFDRLVPGAEWGPTSGACTVKPDLYAPEREKYGGAGGVALAEELFTSSTQWYIENDIGGLRPSFERAVLAVTFMRALVPNALPTRAQDDFWSAHRRHWGWHVRMTLPTQGKLSKRFSSIAEGVGRSLPACSVLAERAESHAAEVVDILDRAASQGVPVERQDLLLNYLHMDLNRMGFLPAEEYLLGVVTTHLKEAG